MNDSHPNLRAVSDSPWNRAEAYRPDLFRALDTDTRTRQLRLEVHPKIGWLQLSFMALVAAFIGVCLAVTL